MLGLALAYGGSRSCSPGCGSSAPATRSAPSRSAHTGRSGSRSGRSSRSTRRAFRPDVGHAVGLFLWAWAIFTGYMTVGALRVSGAVLLVFVLLTVTFVLLAIGDDGGSATRLHWGGYLGIATAAAAWYASFGAVVNSTFGKTVVPLFPLEPVSAAGRSTFCEARRAAARPPAAGPTTTSEVRTHGD